MPKHLIINSDDYGRTPEGVFYYAMEYLDGIDLQSHQFRSEPQQGIHFAVGKTVLKSEVLPFDPAMFL